MYPSRLFRLVVLACTAIISLLSAASGARAATLGVGDPAPPIVVKSFVKGAPITNLANGETTVVEFWATWCGPCKVSIPHLTELAKKYPKIRFIGVSICEQDQAGVAPFVKEMGKKMDYTVALDSVPAGERGTRGIMAMTWMGAARQNGIPTAFIVGGDGRIEWIGSPFLIDAPIATIAAGKWDSKAVRSMAAQTATLVNRQNVIRAALTKPRDAAQSIADLDALMAKSPELSHQAASLKFAYLRYGHKNAEALTYGAYIVNVLGKNDYFSLNDIAYQIVDPQARIKPDAAMLSLGLKAAKRADSLAGGRRSDVADTLACAQSATGDTAGAIVTEQRALKLADDNREATACNARLAVFKYNAIANAK